MIIRGAADSKGENDQAYDLEAQPLDFLQEFSEEELQALKNKYGKTLAELEKNLYEYRCIYYSFRTIKILANCSNGLYIGYLIVTTDKGFTSVVQIFSPSTQISYTAHL